MHILDIFKPILAAVFIMGLFFLFVINPLAVFMETKYDNQLDKKDNSLYSIKITDNEMWIKNKIDQQNSSFINIKNINLRNMYASNIKILQTKNDTNKFIMAEKGEFNNNIFSLENVIYYNFKKEEYKNLPNYNLIINFNKDNIINSISKYKLVTFYNYINPIEPAVNPTAKKNANSSRSLGRELKNKLN